MTERPVTQEALEAMIERLEDFMKDTENVINTLQKAANECADNMNGDIVGAKAIRSVDKSIRNYHQAYNDAAELHEKMKSKLTNLLEMKEIMEGDY